MMPTAPKGQKRPADVVGNAVRVKEIATGPRGPYKMRQAEMGDYVWSLR